MSYTLKPVYDAIVDIASDRGRLIKENKIQKYLSLPYFKEVVKYAYDYNLKYNLTKVQFLEKHGYDLDVEVLFQYLEFLASKKGANDEERKNLSILSSPDKETNIVVNWIINKDLKCGASENTFSKFIKDLPTFEIMTCQKVISKFLKWNGGKEYYWSAKKDGVRVINFVESDVKFHLSRNGLEYPNFGIFDNDLIKLSIELRKIFKRDLIQVDGEAISGDKAFNKTMSQIRRMTDIDVNKFKLNVFDTPIDLPFSQRYDALEKVFEWCSFNHLVLVDHNLCNYNEDEVLQLCDWVVENGVKGVDEGVVIKMADSPYIFKEKSKYWCKVKPTDTLDLKVTGFCFGKPGTRLANVVGKLIVDFRGTEVRVGSGLSDKQRQDFLIDLPTLIEVEYKEITPDGSLREPIMKRVRDDKSSHD